MTNRRWKEARADRDGFIADTDWPDKENFIARVGEFDLYKDHRPGVFSIIVPLSDRRLVPDLLKTAYGNRFYFKYDASAEEVTPLTRVGLSLLKPSALEMVEIYRAMKEYIDGRSENS